MREISTAVVNPQTIEEALEEIEHLRAELEEFAYAVSHDVRAPMRHVRSFIQLLLRFHGDELSPEAKEKVELIRQPADRMHAMLEDLLVYSRIGRLEQPMADVNLADLNDEVAAARAAVEGSPEVEVDMSGSVWAEPAQMTQVVRELVKNALLHGKAPVKIAGHVDDQLHIVVSDGGAGIPEAKQEEALGLFRRQVHGDVPGTGAGLALVRRIARRHGGSVSFPDGPGFQIAFSIPARRHSS